MARKRCIVVYVAVSADGYIARPDGSVEWLDRPGTAGDYGMAAFLRSIDTVLWGRKTYEMALGFGEQGTNFGKPLRHCVFTRGSLQDAAAGFELVREPVSDFARRLREEPGRDVWVMGGAELIASLLDADEVDALVLHVIPTLIGAGIPLVAPRHRLVPLTLKSVKAFADGVVRVHYAVERGARSVPAPQPEAAAPPAAGDTTAPAAEKRARSGRTRRGSGRGQPRRAVQPPGRTGPEHTTQPGPRRQRTRRRAKR